MFIVDKDKDYKTLDSRFKICISSFVCTTIKTLSAIR